MNLLRECGDALLLLNVECALVFTVYHNILTELSTGQLVKYETLLTSVDHITVVEILILLCKLCFRRQLHERCEDILSRDQKHLIAVAEFLLAHETMSAEEFEAVFTDEAAGHDKI